MHLPQHEQVSAMKEISYFYSNISLKNWLIFFLSASDWEWEKMDVALLFLFHLMIEELRISDRKKLNRVEFIDLSLCSLCLSFSVF